MLSELSVGFRGVFENKVCGVPAYLTLLHFEPISGQATISLIQDAIAESPNVSRDVQVLLNDINWRPHLVGAVTLLLIEPERKLISQLWKTFDRGSWVMPQLAVVAFMRDREFAQQALKRIKALAPGRISTLLSRLTRRRSGQDEEYFQACKAFASLLALCRGHAALEPQISRVLRSTQAQRMLSDDRDDSGNIVESWLEAAEFHLREAGIPYAHGPGAEAEKKEAQAEAIRAKHGH